MSGLQIARLRAGAFAQWLPLAQGYKRFYNTAVSDEGYAQAWQDLLAGEPLLGLGAWRGAGTETADTRTAEAGAADTGAADAKDARHTRDAGPLLGIAHAVFHASTWAPRVCYLQDLFVAPQARGQGVGEALIAHLAQQAQAQGASRLYWLTHETNTTARRLYDRVAAHHGFIRYDHRMAPPPP